MAPPIDDGPATSRLFDSLVRHGVLPLETMRAALGRQIVYGGALDTSLLEMGVLDEAAVWSELSRASGLPIPAPALVERADPAAGVLFDVGYATRCRAVPVARQGDTLQLLCGEPLEAQALREASADLGLALELFVVPEVRLKVAGQAVYGQSMPPRFLRLLARLLGAEPVRRWAESHAAYAARRNQPAPAAAAQPAPAAAGPGETGGGVDPAAPIDLGDIATVDSGDVLASMPTAARIPVVAEPAPVSASDDETLFRVAADPRAPGRIEALREVRRRPETALVRELAATFREDASFGSPEKAMPAVEALGELRDARAVVLLVGLVKSEDTTLGHAAQRALVEITKQDFGASKRRWTAWWQEHGHEQRTDWLFEGLSHRVPAVRASAAEELGELSGGEYFGYHFDLPKTEREEARGRWQAWWREREKASAPAEAASPPAARQAETETEAEEAEKPET